MVKENSFVRSPILPVTLLVIVRSLALRMLVNTNLWSPDTLSKV